MRHRSEIVTVEVTYELPTTMSRSDIENLLYSKLWPVTLQGIRDRRDMHLYPEEYRSGHASMDIEFFPAGTLTIHPRRGHMQYRFGYHTCKCSMDRLSMNSCRCLYSIWTCSMSTKWLVRAHELMQVVCSSMIQNPSHQNSGVHQIKGN